MLDVPESEGLAARQRDRNFKERRVGRNVRLESHEGAKPFGFCGAVRGATVAAIRTTLDTAPVRTLVVTGAGAEIVAPAETGTVPDAVLLSHTGRTGVRTADTGTAVVTFLAIVTR
jgi:hypothetical protein